MALGVALARADIAGGLGRSRPASAEGSSSGLAVPARALAEAGSVGPRTMSPCGADGIRCAGRRFEDDSQCLLVIIGATPEAKKELVALHRRGARDRREIVAPAARWPSIVARNQRSHARTRHGQTALSANSEKARSRNVASPRKPQPAPLQPHKTGIACRQQAAQDAQHSKAKRARPGTSEHRLETMKATQPAPSTVLPPDALPGRRKYDKAEACLVKDRATMLAVPRLSRRALEAAA